ncbi:MAG: tRNA lysidine(34) synthetase TilS [Spirochaetes bacterium RIFOXYC1_FULL_54_7]|nr:MAG: tRNA lysidine(34) synthetase TilS [Spirochaetes bacterium RIFOXYC1_FULL_54_7]
MNHGLRPEEELDHERVFIEELCDRLSIPLKVALIPRGRILEEAGRDGGIEAAARRFRYAALEEARLATDSDLVLTAHTADDWLETMLMRFFSGSGTSGLRGIPRRLPTMARPFLDIYKDQILLYLKAKGQEYSVDSTNLGLDFMRNRIRQDLVPPVLEVFPSAVAALKTLATKVTLDDEALESWTESLFDGHRLPSVAFFAAPLAVRIRALYRLGLQALDAPANSMPGTVYGTVPGGDPGGVPPARRIPWAFMEKAASSNPASGILGQGAGLMIQDADGFICASRIQTAKSLPAGALSSGFSLEVQSPGRFRIGTGIECRIYCRQEPDGLRLDAFEWPVIFRSRRSGDVIQLGAGSRQLDRLLADLQIPASLRDTVPLVEDRAGIVAVLGSLAGSRDIYRRNDALAGHSSSGFLVLEMKGVVSDDAVQR